MWHADEYEGDPGIIASTVSQGVTLASNWTIGRWVPLFLAGVSNGGVRTPSPTPSSRVASGIA